MLPWAWATERLAASRSYWIATADADGRPRSAPVWGLWLAASVVFGTSRRSRKGQNLARDPRVVVHLESGDEVVTLEGTAEPISLDDRIADAYGAKYDYRPDPADPDAGAWYRVRPASALAWREAEYPRTATRFVFD